MRNSFLTGLIGLLFVSAVFGQNAQEVYIDQFKDIAIEEMHRTGIPASIKMAQAILESNAGRSHLAQQGNNHFGIKCGGEWSGGTVMRKDDDYKNGRLIHSCFRAYENANESFMAHSEFLRDPKKNHRYGFLFRLPADDYKRWARGLKKAGYATNPKYPQLLINLIEKYQLHQFDEMKEVDPTLLVQEESYSPSIQMVNDVEYVYARPGETPRVISLDFGVSPERLVNYNEGIEHADQKLEAGHRVFLQKKRRSYRGEKKFHYVKEGETMYDLSQKYGVRLERLLKKNKLDEGQEPAIGERIRLRGLSWFDSAPTTRDVKENILPEDTEENLPADEDVQALPEKEQEESESVPEPTPKALPDTVVTAVSKNPPAISLDTISTTEVLGQPVEDAGLPVETEPTYHDVEKGETLYSISRRFDLSVEELKEKNDLSGNALSIGQRLRVK
jgi:LysM repeat protein